MSIAIIIACVFASAVPMLVYIAIIWWLDRYEREPVWVVGVTFFYGASVSIVVAIFASNWVLELMAPATMFEMIAVVAPLVEEPSKASIVFLLLFSRRFDNATDGLVYGAAAGLGFAMTENFLYFVNAYDVGGSAVLAQTVIARTLLSALMHCGASAAFGALVGRHRYGKLRNRLLVGPATGLLVAIGIHAAFNGSIVLHGNGLAILIVPAVGAVLLVAAQLSLRSEHMTLQAELRDEAILGTIPEAHAEILPYWARRRRSGWLNPKVDKNAYIKAATLLAFRKHQQTLPRPHPSIKGDITRYREEVRLLLGR